MFPSGGMGKYGKTFQDMQKKLQKLDVELKERVVEAAAGGGMVKVKVNGGEEIVDIKIEKDVINPTTRGCSRTWCSRGERGHQEGEEAPRGGAGEDTGMVMPGLM
jgi:hypothetical protein